MASESWLNHRRARGDRRAAARAAAALRSQSHDATRCCGPISTTPADIQNKFANMVKGSYKQGAYHPLQMGYLRPNQECSQYRTPVKNLYLGGASVAPGGMVIFGPGYNCANAIAEDFGIEKWWKEPEYVTTARDEGYV